MDFVRSYFFPNATLTSWTFLDHFCHHFWVSLLLLCCCTHPKVMTKMAKNCSTGQSCIRKEVTSYKIGTLVKTVQQQQNCSNRGKPQTHWPFCIIQPQNLQTQLALVSATMAGSDWAVWLCEIETNFQDWQ